MNAAAAGPGAEMMPGTPEGAAPGAAPGAQAMAAAPPGGAPGMPQPGA
jgi:hypothetical protein